MINKKLKNKLQDQKFINNLKGMKPTEYIDALKIFPLSMKYNIMCRMCDDDQIKGLYNVLLENNEETKTLLFNLKKYRRKIKGINY